MKHLLFILLLGGCSPKQATPPFVLWFEVKKVFDARCHSCHNSTSELRNWSRVEVAEKAKEDIYFRVCVAKTMPIGYINKPERELICIWSKQ